MPIHNVTSGETVTRIAANSKCTVQELLRLNPGLDPNNIQIGQELVTPDTNVAKNSALLTPQRKEFKATNEQQKVNLKEYKVNKNDTLSKIAAKCGCSVAQLKAANNLKSDNIKIGQKLIIPTIAKPDAKTVQTAKTSDKLNQNKKLAQELENIKPQLKKDEGKRVQTYFATEGKATIGYGHQLVNKPQFLINIENEKVSTSTQEFKLRTALLNPKNKAAFKANIEKDLKTAQTNTGATGVSTTVADNLTLTDAQIEMLLNSDLKNAENKVCKIVGQKYWNGLSTQQKEVLYDVYFNGALSKSKAPTLLKLIKENKLADAQKELDFFRDEKKVIQKGLIARNFRRMNKWNNGIISKEAQDKLLTAYNKYCERTGKTKAANFDEVKQILQNA